jgi:hypothetical protein
MGAALFFFSLLKSSNIMRVWVENLLHLSINLDASILVMYFYIWGDLVNS